MPFRILRILDQLLGKFLLVMVIPLCGIISGYLPKQPKRAAPKTITILKLHGGGSLLIALPALLGLRTKHPEATIHLVGTPETQKYAELTGVFDQYIVIDSTSFARLVWQGIKALVTCFRHDVLIDLEPHSRLAGVFTPMTFSTRRIGLVKADALRRAKSYTDAIYFNQHAPIHVFYEQIAALLNAKPASSAECQAKILTAMDASSPLVTYEHPHPVVFISPFASSLSPERMMPTALWIEQLKHIFGTQPYTVMIGGGPKETAWANKLEKSIAAALPLIKTINACGKRSLQQAVADINGADEFWGIDSGPLHIARSLQKKCVSYWGPTNPAFLLKPIDRLDERVVYRRLPCSPCVHIAATSPCQGNNLCMKQLFEPDAPIPTITL